MKNKIILATLISTALALALHAADVSYYLVTKGQEQKQTNATTLFTQTNESPFRFLSIVTGSNTGLVSAATLRLPSALTLVLDNSDGSFQTQAGFVTKSGLDGAYGTGNYRFNIQSVNDGTNQPTLALAADAYPAAPVIANWADLQAVEPDQPLTISWRAFTNATANDFVSLAVDEWDGNPVVSSPDLLQPGALNGTNSAVVIAANTLDYGTNYEGRVLIMKRTALATTNYPGASGLAGYYRQTIFPVTTLPAPPAHGRIQFSASSSSVLENAGAAQLTVTRAGTEGGVSVDVFTSGGTATAGADYETLSETLHFEDGENVQTIPVTILDDYALEGNETVNVWLANATDGAELGGRTNLLLTILDNEIAAAGKLQFSLTNFPAQESSNRVVITVNRVGGSVGLVTASYATQAGTAEDLGVDFGTSAGTLIFSNGITSRQIIIPIVNDALDETNEVFRIQLTATSGGAALGTNVNSTVTIAEIGRASCRERV